MSLPLRLAYTVALYDVISQDTRRGEIYRGDDSLHFNK
jgi:hypothetical protein